MRGGPSGAPADGTTGVPLNASVWIFGEEQGGYVVVDGAIERKLGHSYWGSPRIQKLDLGPLAASHTYTVKMFTGEHVTTFTTGTDVDSTPPDPPTLDSVRYEAGRLSIAAVSDGGVAVWVTVRRDNDRKQRAWRLFPADDFSSAFETCNQFDKYAPGSTCVELTSVDLAYNQSRIVSNCTPIVGVHYLLASADRETGRDVKRELILIGLGVLFGLGLIVFRRRVASRRLRTATTAPLVRADVIIGARELRRRMTLLALACSGVFAFGWVLPIATFDEWLPALVPVIALALFVAAKAARAHRALALLLAADSEVTTDGHRFAFVLRDGKLQTFLEIGRRAPSCVPLTGIPKATARINDQRHRSGHG